MKIGNGPSRISWRTSSNGNRCSWSGTGAGERGEKPTVPAPGYKWSQTPELNQAIYEKYREWTLDEVMKRFAASSVEILDVIEGLSDADLFMPGRYAWTNKNTLGTYFVSATSSHYLWARNEIRKRFKADKG